MTFLCDTLRIRDDNKVPRGFNVSDTLSFHKVVTVGLLVVSRGLWTVTSHLLPDRSSHKYSCTVHLAVCLPFISMKCAEGWCVITRTVPVGVEVIRLLFT